MTPKIKAIEIVTKFYNSIYLDLDYEQSKYAALIAVDEILDMITEKDIDVWDYENFNFYKEVKQEIEKL